MSDSLLHGLRVDQMNGCCCGARLSHVTPQHPVVVCWWIKPYYDSARERAALQGKHAWVTWLSVCHCTHWWLGLVPPPHTVYLVMSRLTHSHTTSHYHTGWLAAQPHRVLLLPHIPVSTQHCSFSVGSLPFVKVILGLGRACYGACTYWPYCKRAHCWCPKGGG